MAKKEKFTFFAKGIFSQWHGCAFTVDGVQYNCAEQYMMAEKARLFGDKEMEKEILSSTMPKQQKAFGRNVKNFDPEKWNANARDIVYRGSYAKYAQNPELRKALLATKGTTIVEAAPWDKVWGIGLAADDKKARNRDTWRGKNWLGEVLTRVRDDIAEGVERTTDFGWI